MIPQGGNRKPRKGTAALTRWALSVLCLVLLAGSLSVPAAAAELPPVAGIVWDQTAGTGTWTAVKGAATYAVRLLAYPEGTPVLETETKEARVSLGALPEHLADQTYYLSVQALDGDGEPLTRETSGLENTSGLIDALSWDSRTDLAAWRMYRDREGVPAAYYQVRVRSGGETVWSGRTEDPWIDLGEVLSGLGAGTFSVTVRAYDGAGEPLTRETATGQLAYTPPHVHRWGPWTVTRPAAAAVDGEETRICRLDPSHTETRTIPALGRGMPFADVGQRDYFYEAVVWAYGEEIAQGTGDAAFSPDAPCTRAQTVTFLWRAMGSPSAGSGRPFSDVGKDAYCDRAVRWAALNGVTQGTGAKTFSPDAPCTRGQALTMLWRALGSPETEGSAAPFPDVAPGVYCGQAVRWAAWAGVAVGAEDGRFLPERTCTRAQTVTFLYRALG